MLFEHIRGWQQVGTLAQFLQSFLFTRCIHSRYCARVSEVILDKCEVFLCFSRVAIANNFKDRVQATLGYGAFGTVVNAKDIVTGGVVAVKLLHRGDAFQGDMYREQRVYEELLQGGDSRIEQVIPST